MHVKHSSLPQPEPQAISHSLRLIHFIREHIKQHGPLRFQDYMNQVLYAPSLGYYSAGSDKIGPQGDFITAPEISPLFAACLARQCQTILAKLSNGVIFELGAGLGTLAADLLLTLESMHSLPSAYWILEVSSDLKARQQQTLQSRCPHLLSKVKWLDELPKHDFSGIILGNEVIDALPIARFIIDKQIIKELAVAMDNERFAICHVPTNPALQNKVINIEQTVGKFADGYCSEVNLLLDSWLHSINQHFTSGVMLWIDYGYTRQEYYAPYRTQGTLQCYYQHRVHDNPLLYPGLQDITAHVDFTALAEAASHCNLQVAGYTNQASFLINCGIEQLMQQALSLGQASFNLSQQVKTLLSPQAMGESFKVMALTKNFSQDLLGFNINSQLYKL